MREIKEGWYDFMGNAVRVEDGVAYDEDAGEEIPYDMVTSVCDFVRAFTDEDY